MFNIYHSSGRSAGSWIGAASRAYVKNDGHAGGRCYPAGVNIHITFRYPKQVLGEIIYPTDFDFGQTKTFFSLQWLSRQTAQTILSYAGGSTALPQAAL